MQFNKIVPEFYVSDIIKSLDFYKWLGFVVKYDRPERKFAFLDLDGGQIMLCERNGTWETGELIYPFGRGINFEVGIDDIDAMYKKITKNKYPLYQDMTTAEYRQNDKIIKQKEFLIQDPDGYLWRFCSSNN